MHSKIKLIILSIASCCLLTGCFDKKDENTIVVGLSSDYPPFEFQQQDGAETKLVGFDVDLAEHLANKMNKKLVIKDMALYSLLASLQSKNLDMVISGISPTTERQKSVAFSDIYYKSQMAMLFDAKRNLIKELNELKGKVIGVQTGTTMESYLNDSKKIDGITVLSQDNNLQLVEHLRIGRIDAMLVDLDQAIAFKNLSPDFAYLPIEASDEYGFAIAMNLKDADLKNQVNALLAQMHQDGTIDALKKKWLVQKIDQTATEPNAESKDEGSAPAPTLAVDPVVQPNDALDQNMILDQSDGDLVTEPKTNLSNQDSIIENVSDKVTDEATVVTEPMSENVDGNKVGVDQ